MSQASAEAEAFIQTEKPPGSFVSATGRSSVPTATDRGGWQPPKCEHNGL